MVSRRTFFTITLIMLVLLFMFQAPEVIKDRMNAYGTNDYADLEVSAYTKDLAYPADPQQKAEDGRRIVYIGNTMDGSTGSMVRRWCQYTKRSLKSYSALQKYDRKEGREPGAILIDGKYLSKKDTQRLMELAEQGIDLIFCNLPDLQRIKADRELQELMGIRAVLFEKTKLQGIHLFGGFLLGGEKIYQLDGTMRKSQQDLDLTIPWCQTASGTKAYMVGMTGDDTKNEELPAIIWRNSIGPARIFVVNGDYLADNGGMGFLEAMFYEMDSYTLYPIINAQNLVTLDHPSMVSENNTEMMRLYSQSMRSVFRDVVWPGLATVSEKSNKKLTCLFAPQQDYTDGIEPDAKMLVYYMKALQEKKGEAGLSLSYKNMEKGKPSIADKLDQDEAFLDSEVPDYKFLSLYDPGLAGTGLKAAMDHSLLQDVRTVFADYDPVGELISYDTYLDGSVTRQCAINDGYSHTFSEDLRMNSIQTVLGYSSISVDLDRVAYPQSQADSWEKLFDRFSSNTNTYFRYYRQFASTTLAESDLRIRRFLALDHTQQQEGDTIRLSIENFDEEAYFILRLQNGEAREAEGAVLERISEGIYLITAKQAEVTISVENKAGQIIYQ